MDTSFHYLLMVSYSLFLKHIREHVADMDLTLGQPKVLDYLYAHDGDIQKNIAFGCQIDPATMTGILKRMEDKGLIQRLPIKGNRRSNSVHLTDEGRIKAEKLVQIFKEAEKRVLEGIPEKDRIQLVNSLYKICSNMTEMEKLQ